MNKKKYIAPAIHVAHIDMNECILQASDPTVSLQSRDTDGDDTNNNGSYQKQDLWNFAD